MNALDEIRAELYGSKSDEETTTTDPSIPTKPPSVLDEVRQVARANREIEGEFDAGNVGRAILGELVKSYGFKYNDATDDWEWQAGNIVEAFKDDPFWTTLDYATLAVPALKWGTAAKAVSAAQKAGRAGKVAEISGRGQHILRAAAEGELGFGQATRAYVQSGPTLLGTPRLRAGSQFTPEDLRLMERYGAHEKDVMDLGAAMERERKRNQVVWNRWRNEIVQDIKDAPLSQDAKASLLLSLERGEDLSKNEIFQKLRNNRFQLFGAGSDPARGFASLDIGRRRLHEDAFDYALFPETTYKKYADGKYLPRLYEEFEFGEEALGAATKAPAVRGGGKQRFMHRTLKQAREDRVLNPEIIAKELASAGSEVVRRKFIFDLARTPLVKNAEDLAQMGIDNPLAAGWVNYGDELYGVSRMRRARSELDAVAAGHRSLNDLPEDIRHYVQTLIERRGGVDEAVEYLGERMQKSPQEMAARIQRLRELGKDSVKHLPDNPHDFWIHPSAIEKSTGAVNTGPLDALQKTYWKALEVFKKSKTSQNIASQFRNFWGNQFFTTLALGHPSAKVVQVGNRALRNKHISKDFRQALESGVIGDNNIGQEVFRHLENLYGRQADDAADLTKIVEKIAGQKSARKIGDADRWLGQVYAGTDEAYKIGIFAELRDRFIKQGLDEAKAVDRAALETLKYMPNYAGMNPAVDMARRHIPFLSFPLESARVWKNAMIHKPHLVYGFNHLFETLSYAGASAVGMTPDQLDANREAMREFTHKKKMWALPLTDPDGRPYMLDMSYIGPMFDVGSEATQNAIEIGDWKIPIPDLINPISQVARNPLVAVAGGVAAGKDLYSGYELRPQLTENWPGADEPKGMRPLYAAGEHTARTFVPPLTPGLGYGAKQLGQAITGEVHPRTGKPFQPDVLAALGANVLGLRTYKSDLHSQIVNEIKTEREFSERMSIRWDKFEKAWANGDLDKARELRQEIIDLRDAWGQDGEDYFEKNVKRHEPGAYRDLSRRQLEAVLGRAEAGGRPQEEVDAVRGRLLERDRSTRRPRRATRPTRRLMRKAPYDWEGALVQPENRPSLPAN